LSDRGVGRGGVFIAQVGSIYLSCISLATVGYGDIHPKTEGGYAFTTVWLLCGTVVIAKAIGSSLTYVMDRQRYQYMMDTFDPSDMNSGKIMHLDSVRASLRFASLCPSSHWRRCFRLLSPTDMARAAALAVSAMRL